MLHRSCEVGILVRLQRMLNADLQISWFLTMRIRATAVILGKVLAIPYISTEAMSLRLQLNLGASFACYSGEEVGEGDGLCSWLVFVMIH